MAQRTDEHFAAEAAVARAYVSSVGRREDRFTALCGLESESLGTAIAERLFASKTEIDDQKLSTVLSFIVFKIISAGTFDILSIITFLFSNLI